MSKNPPVPAHTLSIVAHTSKGTWSPDGDDRWLADGDRRLFYVANGAGPKYGGYHAPFGLDPGLDALRHAFFRSAESEPARLLTAFAEANTVLRRLDAVYQQAWVSARAKSAGDLLGAALRAADAVRPQRWRNRSTFCHFTGAITACSIQPNGTLCVAQVGDGRAYLMREGRIRLLVADHTLPTVLAQTKGSTGALVDEHALDDQREIVTRLLGFSEVLETDHTEEWLASGDTILLCSPGVWNHAWGEELVRRLMAATPDVFSGMLETAARDRSNDVTAVRVSI